MNEKSSIVLDAQLVASLVEEQVALLASTVRPDYLAALEAARANETSERGRSVLEQLLANAQLAKQEGLPLCQDTGYVWVCLEVSGPVCVPANVFSGVDAAVARATEVGGLRKSLLHDALVNRTNTATNTPAFCEVLLRTPASILPLPAEVPSPLPPDATFPISAAMTALSPAATYPAPPLDEEAPCDPLCLLHIMLKGGGSDNASSLQMLPPSAGVEGVLDFVEQTVAQKGANACPPLVLGVGVGSSFDKVASLAKHALLRPLGSLHPNAEIAALEDRLLARINALGIGPGGLGGSTTALAVHIESAPCHIAALPVAVNIGCTALRSVTLDLAGEAPIR